MSDLKITVGGTIEGDAAQRFINAGHRAERDEAFQERPMAFESPDALVRGLSGERIALLHHVHRRKVAGVRALAKALGRDRSNVPAAVQALAAGGRLETTDAGLRGDDDAIETRIAL